jgi:SAM-dependent methyltransferase
MSSNARNRAFWNAFSDEYQAEHGHVLSRTAMAWGVWRIPESELKVLGDVEGRQVLELGCGAAQWTLGLHDRGASAVGIDLSEQQLAHARAAARSRPPAPGLVHGDAERLPFRSGAFDIVFCDHGAIAFARPEVVVPEISRVLRSGGLCALCMSTPIRDICFDASANAVTRRLAGDYFRLSAFDDGSCVEYQLPYGAWVRLFRSQGLVVDDLIELRPPPHASTSFADFVPASWAERWPAEHIWRLTKTA